MALVHEFFLIDPRPVSAALAAHYRERPEDARNCIWPTGPLGLEAKAQDDRLMGFYNRHRWTGLEIHDDFIEGHCRDFRSVPALFNGCIPNWGLNYYAITVFEHKHLPRLRAVAETLPGLEPLAKLCKEAESRGMDIVHFGI